MGGRGRSGRLVKGIDEPSLYDVSSCKGTLH